MRSHELPVVGVAAVRAALEARPAAVRRFFLHEARVAEFGDVLRALAASRVAYRIVSDEELARIAGTDRHEGVVVVTDRPTEGTLEDLPTRGPSLVLAAPGLENPHNLGALLRVGAHFGVDALLLEDADPRLSAAACRVAEGGAEAVPILRVERLEAELPRLRQMGYAVYATSSHTASVDLGRLPLPSRLVWVVGAESRGLPRGLRDKADACVRIPGSGRVESLNVATAAAVLLATSRLAQGPVRST